MHQIGVVGVSYRHVGLDEVARFAIPKAEIATRLAALRDGLSVSEIVYVATCNRVEVLYASADGLPAADCRREIFRTLIGREPQGAEASRVLRAWTGEAAIEHLFLVTCGLDSAQTGEQEIAAQIRGAWETARGAQTCGPVLDRLLGEALSMASRVHRLSASVRPPSLADLASDRVLRALAGKPATLGSSPTLVGESAIVAHQPATAADELATVALLGVSPMTRRCGMILHRAGIPLLVVNRTPQAAEEFAALVGGKAMPFDEFRAKPPKVAALILAAGGGEPILGPAALANIAAAAKEGRDAAPTEGAKARGPLLIDFGVPPNADPEACRAAGLTRVGMDHLIQAAQEQRLAQLMRLAPVRAAIDERLNRLRGELATRAIGRQLADLRGTFEQIAAEEADRALAAELRNLDDSQRELFQRFASTVARRLAHLPLAGLRAAAAHASSDAVDAFFREARLRRFRQPGRSDKSPGRSNN
jgi:glutamyl-tRNA reductase